MPHSYCLTDDSPINPIVNLIPDNLPNGNGAITWYNSQGSIYTFSSLSLNDVGTYYAVKNGVFTRNIVVKDLSNSLPIELISFEAELYNENKVLLNWITASIINTEYFIIQKSTDGINWNELEIIVGQGDSDELQHYNTEDIINQSGIYYYKVIQVDFDRSSDEASIVAVEVKVVNSEVIIYPNPTSNFLMIEFDAPID